MSGPGRPATTTACRIWYGTGLKLGAAGIGWFLLRLARSGSSLKDWPVIPDERL